MTRLLVTGATGYIGSAVLRQALAAGYQVYALTRSEKTAARLTSLGAIPVIGDLLIPGPWQKDANASEVVIHLAQPETYGARVTTKRALHWRRRAPSSQKGKKTSGAMTALWSRTAWTAWA